MINAGSDCTEQTTPEEVAFFTLRTMLRCVPGAMPGIHFLSGGMSDQEVSHIASFILLFLHMKMRLTLVQRQQRISTSSTRSREAKRRRGVSRFPMGAPFKWLCSRPGLETLITRRQRRHCSRSSRMPTLQHSLESM